MRFSWIWTVPAVLVVGGLAGASITVVALGVGLAAGLSLAGSV